jgi:uncharacterized protein YndB with AHSA1/START domain
MTDWDETPPTARRSIEIEVPGTPEQVWEAIATGPGITAWFVPAEVDGREGGSVTTYHGVGEEAASREVIRVWDPPRRLLASTDEPWGIEGVTLATEFLVEARTGGTCVVRIVASGFGDKDWEQEMESYEHGWGLYLRNLRLYLTHFRGQACSPILVTGNAPGSQQEAWTAFRQDLGVGDPRVGDRVSTGPGAPPLAGLVEVVAEDTIMLRLEEPAPGMAFVGAFTWNDRVFTTVHAYLFGGGSPEIAARDQTAWDAWMDEHFPVADVTTGAGATAG